MTLVVVNRGPDAQTIGLQLTGFYPSENADVWRFDSSHNAEQVEAQSVQDGSTLTLSGQSITSYIVKGQPAS